MVLPHKYNKYCVIELVFFMSKILHLMVLLQIEPTPKSLKITNQTVLVSA